MLTGDRTHVQYRIVSGCERLDCLGGASIAVRGLDEVNVPDNALNRPRVIDQRKMNYLLNNGPSTSRCQFKHKCFFSR